MWWEIWLNVMYVLYVYINHFIGGKGVLDPEYFLEFETQGRHLPLTPCCFGLLASSLFDLYLPPYG